MIVVKTNLMKIPKSCFACKYYSSEGNRGGRYNDGICFAHGTFWSTEGIKVTRQRLSNCPLRQIDVVDGGVGHDD